MKLRIHLAGVGGQGTQTASRVLGEAAMRAGIPVLVSALHGMAQRGGAVTNQVILGSARSPVIDPGQADVVVGFEPIEAARSAALPRPGALVIVSRSCIVPYSLTASGGTYPDVEGILAPLRAIAGRMATIDACGLAARAGDARAVGPVMLGALAAAAVLPFSASDLRVTLSDLSLGSRRAVSLAAFDLGLRG